MKQSKQASKQAYKALRDDTTCHDRGESQIRQIQLLGLEPFRIERKQIWKQRTCAPLVKVNQRASLPTVRSQQERRLPETANAIAQRRFPASK